MATDSLPFDYSCTREAIDSLAPEVLQSLRQAAEAYFRETGLRLHVTSARRSLRHTAALMAAFSIPQLEGMYCRHGYPSYIRDIAEKRQVLQRELTAEETYSLLCKRSEGYISAHLFGGACDIAVEGVPDKAFLERVLLDAGFVTLDETALGIACIHASHPAVEKQIIRQ